jgi:hypothetical protein
VRTRRSPVSRSGRIQDRYIPQYVSFFTRTRDVLADIVRVTGRRYLCDGAKTS